MCLGRVLQLQEEAAYRPSDSRSSWDILDMFTVGVVRHWKVSKEAVASTLEVFTARSNGALSNLTLGKVDKMVFKDPFQANHPTILFSCIPLPSRWHKRMIPHHSGLTSLTICLSPMADIFSDVIFSLIYWCSFLSFLIRQPLSNRF